MILWQVWSFVAPGLRPVEKKFVGPFVASAFLLFAGGAAFAYFVMPIGLNFLATFLGNSAVYLPDINAYLSFLLLLIIAFGVTFSCPWWSSCSGCSASSRRSCCAASAR